MADAETAGSSSTEPIPAATVIPLRDGPSGLEVLLLRRSGRGVFGGMWVFPGGQVDPGDFDGASRTGGAGGEETELAAARRAAVREAEEEAGIVLDEGSLVHLSFWLPPPTVHRRFATWFFSRRPNGPATWSSTSTRYTSTVGQLPVKRCSSETPVR